MSIILHITRRTDWEAALASGSYAPDSLRTQGFIHCSTPEQVVPVANFLFKGQKDLVLLCIETDRVEAEIRCENLEGGAKLFPHVYGALGIEAVVSVFGFPPKDDGAFELPRDATLMERSD